MLMRVVRLGLVTIILLAVMVLSSALVSYAQVGVGITPSKISIDEPLVPGEIYRLPAISVVNTGEVASDYEVVVSYSSEQTELTLPAEWVNFEPERFHLEPGETRQVAVTLNVPVRAMPGDYFAYLEAHPIGEGNGVAIGVAVATKLDLTVKPSNVFMAVWAKVSGFFAINAPASYIGLGVLVAIGLVFLFRRFFRVRFRLERVQ
jgi:hypothetical protein